MPFGVAVLAMLWLAATKKKAHPAARCNDVPFFETPGNQPYQLPGLLAGPRHDPFQRTSFYLPMSDGVELAVDIYLPPNYSPSINNENNGLPTFLHLTRYHRAEKRTWWARFLLGAPV